ncbi:MAG: sensor histidine kinase [Thermoplasmatota archaeon]
MARRQFAVPAKEAVRSPGALPGPADNERELMASAARASLPPVLLFVGAVYVVFSGTIFFYLSGTQAAWLWAATAGVGLLLVGVGLLVRRGDVPVPDLHLGSMGLAALVVAHALLVLWITRDLGQTSYLMLLLIGAGSFVLLGWGLAVVDAIALAGWFAIARDLGIDPIGAQGSLVIAGIVIGGVAHVLRRRTIHKLASTKRDVLGNLEASEERFRSLAETAKDAILLLDGDGRLTYLNPAGMALFGLRPQDLGRPAGHLLGAAGNEPSQLVGTNELLAQRKDGSTFPAELSLAATERDDGSVAYTGVLRDVTERKKAEEATQAATSREAELETLRKMNSFKTQFLNTAAHELNTPLTPLRLQLHLLKAESMGPLNERQAKAVALLDRNVTRLSGLVGEILEVARLQSGRVRLTPTRVEVDAVVDEVIESFNETARKVGVALAFEGTPGLHVHADRNRFTQVLFNLVSNALKFTPAGGSVTVDARHPGGGTSVEIQVRDTGLGLSDEQMARLFQPFSQVHDPMAVPATGTGLGLYICKGLVEAQGGRITVKSPGPGRGSTFSFTLPLGGPEQPAVARPEAGPEPVRAVEDPMVRRLRELI